MSERLIALVDALRELPEEERRSILGRLGPQGLAALAHSWRRFWARQDQLPPESTWTYWALIGGRGSGKTRSCAEWVLERVRTGAGRRIHLVAATYDDARETMIDGESGICTIAAPHERPTFVSSVGGGILLFPNGARGRVFSAEEPQRLRGPQCDTLWCDDIAAWGVNAFEAWNQAMWGFRLGDCRCAISTTPNAMELLVSLIQDGRSGLVVVPSSTDLNKANLSANFFEHVVEQFSGTQIEAQERFGQLLVKVEGALFQPAWIEKHRVSRDELPEFVRIVVAVDPAITETDHSDDTGIVVLGLGVDGRLYVLEDLTGPHSPKGWAGIVVEAFHEWRADCVVVETNRGGSLVRRNLEIEAPNLPIREVTAARDKATRAEPLAHAYEKGKVSHLRDGRGLSRPLHRKKKPESLEAEMTSWVPAKKRSPNGIDALVWGAAELLPLDSHKAPPRKPQPAHAAALRTDVAPRGRRGSGAQRAHYRRARSEDAYERR